MASELKWTVGMPSTAPWRSERETRENRANKGKLAIAFVTEVTVIPRGATQRLVTPRKVAARKSLAVPPDFLISFEFYATRYP